MKMNEINYDEIKNLIIKACVVRDFCDIPTVKNIHKKTIRVLVKDYNNSEWAEGGYSLYEFLMNCACSDLNYYAFY